MAQHSLSRSGLAEQTYLSYDEGKNIGQDIQNNWNTNDQQQTLDTLINEYHNKGNDITQMDFTEYTTPNQIESVGKFRKMLQDDKAFQEWNLNNLNNEGNRMYQQVQALTTALDETKDPNQQAQFVQQISKLFGNPYELQYQPAQVGEDGKVIREAGFDTSLILPDGNHRSFINLNDAIQLVKNYAGSNDTYTRGFVNNKIQEQAFNTEMMKRENVMIDDQTGYQYRMQKHNGETGFMITIPGKGNIDWISYDDAAKQGLLPKEGAARVLGNDKQMQEAYKDKKVQDDNANELVKQGMTNQSAQNVAIINAIGNGAKNEISEIDTQIKTLQEQQKSFTKPLTSQETKYIENVFPSSQDGGNDYLHLAGQSLYNVLPANDRKSEAVYKQSVRNLLKAALPTNNKSRYKYTGNEAADDSTLDSMLAEAQDDPKSDAAQQVKALIQRAYDLQKKKIIQPVEEKIAQLTQQRKEVRDSLTSILGSGVPNNMFGQTSPKVHQENKKDNTQQVVASGSQPSTQQSTDTDTQSTNSNTKDDTTRQTTQQTQPTDNNSLQQSNSAVIGSGVKKYPNINDFLAQEKQNMKDSVYNSLLEDTATARALMKKINDNSFSLSKKTTYKEIQEATSKDVDKTKTKATKVKEIQKGQYIYNNHIKQRPGKTQRITEEKWNNVTKTLELIKQKGSAGQAEWYSSFEKIQFAQKIDSLSKRFEQIFHCSPSSRDITPEELVNLFLYIDTRTPQELKTLHLSELMDNANTQSTPLGGKVKSN